MEQPKSRIWELDALRGLSILCVIVIHLLFDLSYFAGLPIRAGAALLFVQQYGGVVFVVLSGLCATLGRRSLRRGALVFACGMAVTAVTLGMVRLGMAGETVIIRFGVLHLLGVCMMLWPLLRRLPVWCMAALGTVLVILGYWLMGLYVSPGWLFPLGLKTAAFYSADYFPLLPHLGWFLLGAVLGCTAYREKRSLLPRFPSGAVPVRFLRWCGRQSLWIYLLHQPALFVLAELMRLLRGWPW